MKRKKKKKKAGKALLKKTGRQWNYRRFLLPLLGILLVYIFSGLAVTAIPFLQDDAYLSFRYVDNYLNGHGLVFNQGERVEGYTNFLWVILLALAANLGFALPEAARWLGIIFSAGTVVVVMLLARRALAGFADRWVILGAAAAGLWVAVNPALSYWSVAFSVQLLFMLSVFFYLIYAATQRHGPPSK